MPLEPHKRGKHSSFASAIVASLNELSYIPDSFFDTLCDRWLEIFPMLAARPGRREGNKLFLYVKSAPVLFSIRSSLPAIRRTLAAITGAPKRLEVYLEIRK